MRLRVIIYNNWGLSKRKEEHKARSRSGKQEAEGTGGKQEVRPEAAFCRQGSFYGKT